MDKLPETSEDLERLLERCSGEFAALTLLISVRDDLRCNYFVRKSAKEILAYRYDVWPRDGSMGSECSH